MANLDLAEAVLLVILGAVLGIVYSLRRFFKVEKAILNMESKILELEKSVGKKAGKAAPKKKK